MNKFGKLLDKFKKKNKIDQDEVDHEEIDIEEIHEDEVEPEFQGMSVTSEQDSEGAPIPAIPNEDATKEIDISTLHAKEEINNEDGDFEGEEFEGEEFDGEEIEESYTEPSYTQSEVTGEIDLDNSKMGVKDRVDHIRMRVADKFRNLNKKDIYKTMKRPGEEETAPRQMSKKLGKKLKSKAGSINWENIPNEILSSSHHQKIHTLFQVIIVAGMTLFLGNLIGYIFQGKPDYKNTKKSGALVIDDSKLLTMDKISKIKSANVFRTDKVKAPVKTNTQVIDEPKICLTAQRKSSLPIKLMSTIVLQDSVKSIASVSVRSNSKLKRFREGDKIANMAEIGRITGKSLIVKN
jgi:hypothetical protein